MSGQTNMKNVQEFINYANKMKVSPEHFGVLTKWSWCILSSVNLRRDYLPLRKFVVGWGGGIPSAQLPSLIASCCQWWPSSVNSLRPRQNGRLFADDIFECIFLKENVWISIKISLKFVPKGLIINNIPALLQIMAWRRIGDKPLSEAMMVNLPTHICVSRPQWVNCQ